MPLASLHSSLITPRRHQKWAFHFSYPQALSAEVPTHTVSQRITSKWRELFLGTNRNVNFKTDDDGFSSISWLGLPMKRIDFGKMEIYLFAWHVVRRHTCSLGLAIGFGITHVWGFPRWERADCVAPITQIELGWIVFWKLKSEVWKWKGLKDTLS